MPDTYTCLAKFRGCLVTMEVKVSEDQGHCFDCGSTDFREGPHGWVECKTCDFAILKADLDRIKEVSNDISQA